MNLKNGYKTMYEVIEGTSRVFYASKTGLFEDADEIVRYEIGSFEVVYADADHKLYGVDAEGSKVYLDAINNLFTESEASDEVAEITEVEEEPSVQPDAEPVVEPDASTDPVDDEEV